MNTIEEFKAGAMGFYRSATLVADFMRWVHDDLLGTLMGPSSREETILGVFLRAFAWMQTLKKLNNPTDLQAMVSCNRALLEIAIDMTLLHHDKTNESWWRMYCWEQSAKLNAAEGLQNYFLSQDLAVPKEYEHQMRFIADQKAFIENQRLNLWPPQAGKRSRIPNRWTGRNLLQDAQIADQHSSEDIKDQLGTTFTEFYQTEYRRMNWNVHGSGLAAIRDLPPHGFHVECALSYKSCADLAVLCTKMILSDYNFTAYYPELNDKWEELRRQKELHYADARGWLERPDQDTSS